MPKRRYRTRPGLILKVGPVLVTDRKDGHELADTPGVREHVRLGRLRIAAAGTTTPKSKE